MCPGMRNIFACQRTYILSEDSEDMDVMKLERSLHGASERSTTTSRSIYIICVLAHSMGKPTASDCHTNGSITTIIRSVRETYTQAAISTHDLAEALASPYASILPTEPRPHHFLAL